MPNQYGLNFAQMDAEQQAQRSAQLSMLLATQLSPIMNYQVYGPSGVTYGNNVYDNLESQGTVGNYQGSKVLWTPEEAETLKITDGKVGGKIPYNEYDTIRRSSIKNPDAKSITLGKYTDGEDSYIARAGKDSMYFDMGSDWGKIQNKYNLSDAEMFDYFNKHALDNAIKSGKTIRFSHNPRVFGGGFLKDEWEYLKATMNLSDSDLFFNGGFWYVK